MKDGLGMVCHYPSTQSIKTQSILSLNKGKGREERTGNASEHL